MSNSTDEMLILPPKPNRGRHSESENDSLSDLPDDVLLHILSFLKPELAVRTCILSTRWKNLWKRIPTLILHSHDFSTFKRFTKFVSRLLTLRDRSIALQGLDFERVGTIQTCLLKRIAKYAVSHNVQQLGLSVMCGIEHFPHCVFSSRTLTSLKLAVQPKCGSFFKKMLFPESLNLPALTALHLENFVFCTNDNDNAEPFSAFIRLNSLIIHNCSPSGIGHSKTLCISSMTLANLTVHDSTDDFYSIELSSPNLRTFALTGTRYPFCRSNLSSPEQVELDVEICVPEDVKVYLEDLSKCPLTHLILLRWLLKLNNIKSLTVSASGLQVLFLLIRWDKLHISGSLKSLKVKLMREDRLPDGIMDILLQLSPSAKVDIIRCST